LETNEAVKTNLGSIHFPPNITKILGNDFSPLWNNIKNLRRGSILAVEIPEESIPAAAKEEFKRK